MRGYAVKDDMGDLIAYSDARIEMLEFVDVANISAFENTSHVDAEPVPAVQNRRPEGRRNANISVSRAITRMMSAWTCDRSTLLFIVFPSQSLLPLPEQRT